MCELSDLDKVIDIRLVAVCRDFGDWLEFLQAISELSQLQEKSQYV